MSMSAQGVELRKAPEFTLPERAEVSAWAKGLRALGYLTGYEHGYEFLDEALLVFFGQKPEPLWMVHKVPDGRFAVRWWPGPGQLTATLAMALGQISDAIRDVGAHAAA